MCLLLIFDDQFNHTNKQITFDKLTIVLDCFLIACVLLYRRDLLVLQSEVYSVHKSFYICSKYNLLHTTAKDRNNWLKTIF